MEYYVYLYLRKTDLTPYYVGKGKGGRAYNKRRAVQVPNDKARIVFVATSLSESEAFILEKKLIAKWGRKDNGTGILRNLSDGGEGPSGYINSDDTRKRKSVSIKKYHGSLSEEERNSRNESCSKGQQARFAASPESAVTRKRKSEAHMGTYIITSPDGRVWHTTRGLKEFVEVNGSEIGITFWQLFAAYRKTTSPAPVKRVRKDSNKWRVVRID